jgi:hypothetical protein
MRKGIAVQRTGHRLAGKLASMRTFRKIRIMKIKFTVIRLKDGEVQGAGELEFPDHLTAVEVHQDLLSNQYPKILNHLFGIKIDFGSPEAEKAFIEKYKAETTGHGNIILGPDGGNAKPGKIILPNKGN